MIPVYSGAAATQDDSTLIEVKTLQQLEELKKKCTDQCVVLLFWADWHEPCHQIRDQLSEMAKVYKKLKITWCNSDEASELIEKFDVNQVPTIALFHPHKATPDLIENPSPEKVSTTMETQQEFYAKWFEEERQKAFREIDDLVKSPPGFFMFIKGSPDQPKCKFTRKLLETFAPFGYRFRHFDILKDERIRQWLKFYSSWPTFPQIFLSGKFVGGVDIVCELVEAGEFDEMVPQSAKKLPPIEEFKEVLGQHRVVALIEGSADSPNGDASSELVKILKGHGVKFAALDLLQRADLRQALLEASVISTVPSLFVDGGLLGDLHTVTGLNQQGELLKKIPGDCVVETLEGKLKRLVNQCRVMLFMKGSPKVPQCGFSQRIVNLLANYPDVEYQSFDIFKDEQVREGLKKYSNWPTYPQLYVNGELVGGIDICQELHESNELEDVLRGTS